MAQFGPWSWAFRPTFTSLFVEMPPRFGPTQFGICLRGLISRLLEISFKSFSFDFLLEHDRPWVGSSPVCFKVFRPSVILGSETLRQTASKFPPSFLVCAFPSVRIPEDLVFRFNSLCSSPNAISSSFSISLHS